MIPTISVHANVKAGVLGNAKTKEVYKSLQDIRDSLPTGYSIDLDGAAEKSETAVQKLLTPMPIMLFVIMTILMFQLKRIALMIMALLTAPLGLILSLIHIYSAKVGMIWMLMPNALGASQSLWIPRP